jgi:hypothetical protein
MQRRRLSLSFVAALPFALTVAVAVPNAVAAGPAQFTCNGGTVPPGTYSGLTVTGDCAINSGTVNVKGAVTVNGGNLEAVGGSLSANGLSLLSTGSVYLMNSRINGGVQGNESGEATFWTSTITGGIRIIGGFSVDVESSEVTGGISYHDMGTSVPVAVVNSTVKGGISIGDGAIREGPQLTDDQVTGGVQHDGLFDIAYLPSTLSGDVIHGGLVCAGDDPAPADVGGAPNVVTGQRSGECAGV